MPLKIISLVNVKKSLHQLIIKQLLYIFIYLRSFLVDFNPFHATDLF